ncbi:hypothetical protein ANN_21179 [Periplaneta americana]|uniref:DUF659 domain-containing protein n=1 Tax=Periplaneta americana TaxID=6978 RepID=A0ABQ8SFJ3_PERAM|nr:hypothetical protein ANN_21179 [Periplaneta americana]
MLIKEQIKGEELDLVLWTEPRRSSVVEQPCAVSSTQKFLVQQHITTSKHQANKQLNSKQRQLFLTQPTTSNEFLEKYTQHTIPDESTLRKTYAPSIYDETIQKIRDEIKDSSIWVSIDETPNKEGRLVGNVVIGLLSEQYSERILLHCDVLEKCNNKTIVKLFNEAMGILWPKGIMYDNVLFFISDAAPYMVKAGQALSVVYPKLTHFTCVAHAFHRVAEVVRDNFLNTVEQLNRGRADAVRAKLYFQKTLDMKNFVAVMSGESTVKINLDLSPADIVKLNYVPVTSCDVERSFSQYKSILRDNRRRFTFQHLKEMFVTYCYDRIRKETVLERVDEERIKLKVTKKRKRNVLSSWLRRNCLLKGAVDGMVNGREVRSRRKYQIIDNIKIYGSYTETTKRMVENREIGGYVRCIAYTTDRTTDINVVLKFVLHSTQQGVTDIIDGIDDTHPLIIQAKMQR